jgi:hypothetical protein
VVSKIAGYCLIPAGINIVQGQAAVALLNHKVGRGRVRRRTVAGVISPTPLVRVVRGHWSIEDDLHFRLDDTLKEIAVD